ncbi:hypothetical protein F3157_20145 [Virgibacillus dakarensis]|uniref:Uncharacterized protein n=1 Tax=Lentibacillus populi TaxID=1827502 RepID=A0A9W5U1J7_9BACI|nr:MULTISPECIES: hypothetical protein [Bacillaceae]MBT2214638.1 hypothetical protein [Virgibacillus dakarensis]MTW87931.1 hypothetical protein [Virgibacillus dakarensis]GGB58466.1 hypothetical protein GCM10011409_39930 [Lentibacillus populi]
MKQTTTFPKVAKDMFLVQLYWAFGFLGIMLVIHIVKIITAFIQGNEVDSYYNSVFVAANIFMLVIGLISVYFLPHYAGNGVTRKDYFKGGLLASIGLSVVIPIIAICISVIGQFILKNMANIGLKEPNLNEVVLDIDSNIIGDIVQSVILTPFVDPGSNWILAIGLFSLNIFMYYLVGWFISASFYRYDTITGLGSILLGLISLTLVDVLIRMSLNLPVADRFSSLDLPAVITIPGIFVIIVIIIWIIRVLTKRVSIKM